MRSKIVEEFTQKGHPGEKYSEYLSELKAKCHIKSDATEFGIQSLVNSFYHCVNAFPKAKIVFRTFGNDGERAFKEFNLFLANKLDTHEYRHPVNPD